MSGKNDRAVLGQLVTRVARHWRRAIDQELAQSGLSQATALPLIVLARLGCDLRPSAVADELGLEGPSLVRVMDMLVAEGLVTRREDPSDRRAKLLSLTPLGHERVEQIEEIIARVRGRYLAGIGDGELAAVVRGLAKIEEALMAAREP